MPLTEFLSPGSPVTNFQLRHLMAAATRLSNVSSYNLSPLGSASSSMLYKISCLSLGLPSLKFNSYRIAIENKEVNGSNQGEEKNNDD